MSCAVLNFLAVVSKHQKFALHFHGRRSYACGLNTLLVFTKDRSPHNLYPGCVYTAHRGLLVTWSDVAPETSRISVLYLLHTAQILRVCDQVVRSRLSHTLAQLGTVWLEASTDRSFGAV